MRKALAVMLSLCLCVALLAGCAAPAGDVDTSAPDASSPDTSAPDAPPPALGQGLQWYDTLADVPFANLSFGYHRGSGTNASETFCSYPVFFPNTLLRDGAYYASSGLNDMFAAGHPVLADEHEVFLFTTSLFSDTVSGLMRIGLDDTQPQDYELIDLDGAAVTVEDGLLCLPDGSRFDPQTVEWVAEGDGSLACRLWLNSTVPSDWQPGEAWSEQYADWPLSGGDMPADTHGLQIYPEVEDVPHAALSLQFWHDDELGAGAGFEGVYVPKAIQKDGAALDTVSDPQRRYLALGGVAASESELFILTSDLKGGGRCLRRISLTDDHSGDYELAFEARPQLFCGQNEAAAMVIGLSHTEGDVLYLCNHAAYSSIEDDELRFYTFGWDTVQKVWLIDGETVAPIAGVDLLPLGD